jgi:hypothetical protein
VHRYAQYAQSWSVGLFFRIQPTIEHTMSVLDTLCMNFVHTFDTVCTLCVNSCVPARTVCKCVSSKHNVCMKCTFIVRGSHRRHKAHTKCTRESEVHKKCAPWATCTPHTRFVDLSCEGFRRLHLDVRIKNALAHSGCCLVVQVGLVRDSIQ